MTIAVSAARASALATAGEENNPIVTGAPFSGTASTVSGTEILAASNALTGSTFDFWTAEATSTFVVWGIDFGAGVTPTFVAIAAHNLSDLGASVRVQYSDDDVSYTNGSAGIVTPTDNQAIGWRFDDGSHRYWRMTVSGLTSGDEASIGVIWFGTEIILPQRLYQGYTPPLTPTQVDLVTDVSEGAELLGAAYVERGSTFSADLQHIPDTFLRGADWLAFQRRWNRGNGAFWGWRPDKYDEDLFYAWRGGASVIAPTNSGPQARMGMTISGRLYHE